MLLSVIVPVYNAAKHLPGLFDMLDRQIKGDYEVIFVNDGSVDGSLTFIESRQTGYKIVNKANGGVSSARNAGIEAAEGEYITFLDADDGISDDYIKTMLGYAEKKNGLTAFRHTRVVSGGFSFDRKTEERTLNDKELLLDFLDNTTEYGVYDLLIDSAIIKKNNIRFPEGAKYYEDYRFIIDLFSCADGAFLAPECVYCYRASGGSAMSTFNEERMKCLELFTDFSRLKDCEVRRRYEKYFSSRLVWSASWQACSVMGYKEFRAFAKKWEIKRKMHCLLGFTQITMKISAFSFIIFPVLYYVIMRKMGERKTLLAQGE